MSARRYHTEPTVSIALVWDQNRKVWSVHGRLGDRAVHTLYVGSTISMDPSTVKAFCAAVARELELMLPF